MLPLESLLYGGGGVGGGQNASFKIAAKQCLTVRNLIVEKVE